MTEYTTLRLNQIFAGGGTQMRAVLNDETVQDYMEVFDAAGDWGPFPPIVVYYDGAQHWLADGFHRVAALRKWCHPTDPMETRTLVQADIRAGTRRDAILFAAGANASHGLRRTNADKRRAVETMLRDDEWCQWSNMEIARRCNVDEGTVRNLRLRFEATSEIPKSTDRTGADGRTINTANIGRRAEQNEAESGSGGRVFESAVPAPVVDSPLETETSRYYDTRSAPLKNDLTPAEIEAFLRSYWSERELARFAQSSMPFDWCWQQIASSSRGGVDFTCRWETGNGRVYVWLVSHGADYWRREPDAVFTYDRFARMTMDVLPPAVETQTANADKAKGIDDFLEQSKSWTDASAMSAEAVAAELQQYLDDGWERWPAVMGYGWKVMVHPERKLATAEHYGSPALLRAMRQGKYSAEGYAATVASLAVGDDLVMDEPSVTEVSPVDKNELSTGGDEDEDEAGSAGVMVAPVDEGEEIVVPVSQRDGYDGDEWYTPLWVVKLVKDVMGGIDLDPASCEMAQTVVHADGYLTRFDDGLQYHWEGRVFINPPYSMPAAFIAKLQEEVKARRTKEAIVLVNNATETSWFQTMLGQWTVCFLNRRLAFWRHDHADVGARQGQAVFYFGPNVQRFEQVFAPHGTILRRVGVNSYEPV